MPFLSQKQRPARKNKKHNLIFQRQKFFKFFAQAKLYQILQKKSTPFKLLLMLLNIGKTPLICKYPASKFSFKFIKLLFLYTK